LGGKKRKRRLSTSSQKPWKKWPHQGGGSGTILKKHGLADWRCKKKENTKVDEKETLPTMKNRRSRKKHVATGGGGKKGVKKKYFESLRGGDERSKIS